MAGLTLPVAGCDESLPPRNDPQGYFDATLTGESGIVVLNKDLTLVSNLPGGFRVEVKNLYDEVLQGEEAISVDINFHSTSVPSSEILAHGDRNSILDRYMLQGDLLTVEPESSAIFFVQWDHAGEALWNQTTLEFHTEPGNPYDVSWFESGQITLQGAGTVKVFSDVAPLTLEPTQSTISYTIHVGSPEEAIVDSLLALFDKELGFVRIQWQTPFELNNYGFQIEKGEEPTDFSVIYPELIPGQGTAADTTYYSFIDSIDTSSGLRYYRLQRWYDFGFVVWPLDPTGPTSVTVP